jgi:hypothetical protein
MHVDCVWNVMAHALKPDFVFRRNGRVHLNRQEASVQSTTGSRGVRISGSNAGYTMFRGSVKSTGYTLHSPVSPSLPPPVRHRVSSHINWLYLYWEHIVTSSDLHVKPKQCVYRVLIQDWNYNIEAVSFYVQVSWVVCNVRTFCSSWWARVCLTLRFLSLIFADFPLHTNYKISLKTQQFITKNTI